MTRTTEVSALIATHGRPDLVARAVRSALNQTHPPAEIIVVIDGHDDATTQALAVFDDPRLRIIQQESNVGCASARNIGVAKASRDWIAFLDDDDEWLPNKLQIQMTAARHTAIAWPIIAGRAIVRTGNVDLIRPRRAPRRNEPICDYLFRRSLPVWGEGAILTTVLVTPRELLLRTPFTEGLRRLDDMDWFLRVAREPGVGVVFPESSELLAVCHIDEGRSHLSWAGGWEDSLAWGRSRRHLFTPQAYAGFICGNVSARAGRAGQPHLFLELLAEVRRGGTPSWVDFASHIMNFVLTRRTRDAALKLLQKSGKRRT